LVRLVVVMAGGGAVEPILMVSDRVWVCGVGLESFTITVKVKFPGEVGVPEITPELACRLRPGGSEPAVTLHVYGVAPPLAANPAL